MKILRIRFKNINSLRGEQAVDFSTPPLLNSGLFAITGPTGSGKSSLLDVITLALFNRIPRLGKLSKNFLSQSGAVITRNTTEAYAQVEYECSAGRYLSSWEISLNRNGKLREYHMELTDLTSGERLDLKKAQVAPYNEELIGLNYEQFVKSIMLAQGEFAEFLRVNKSERGELLEKITGTGIYRELGKKAYEKKNLFARELEKLRHHRGIIADQLLAAERLQEITAQSKELATQIKERQQKIKGLEAELKLRAETQKLRKELLQLEALQAQHRKSRQEFNDLYADKLRRHESTAPFATLLEDWKRNQQKIKEQQESLSRRRQQEQEQQKARTKLNNEINLFLGEPSHPDKLLKKLENFRDKIISKDQELLAIREQYKSLHKQLQASGISWNYHPQAQEPEKELNKLKGWQEENEQSLAALAAQLGELNGGELETQEQQLQEQLRSAETGQRLQADLIKLAERLQLESQQLEKLQQQQRELPSVIEKLKVERALRLQEKRNLELEIKNQALQASLASHRKNLKEGEACPLCGATHHPWAEEAPVSSDANQEKLAAAENILEKAQRELNARENDQHHFQRQLTELEKRMEELRAEQKEKRASLQSACAPWLQDGKANWEEIISRLKEKQNALKKLEKERTRQQGLAHSRPLLEQMIAEAKNGKSLSEKRQQIYNGKDISGDCNRLRDRWLTVNQQIQNLQQQQMELQEQVSTLGGNHEQLEAKLQPAIKAAGFEDIAAARMARLPEDEYLQLSRRAASLKAAEEKSSTELEALQKTITANEAEKSPVGDEELQESLQKLQKEHETLQEQWEERKRLLKNHRENAAELDKLDKDIAWEEKTGHKWELLCNLIGDATGKKFNDFAQDLSLQQLLILANRRLAQLSDRYRIDKAKSDEDEGLIAIDAHMGDQRRSVKTLSGGETFVLSLSLALALSDLAARNVEINSLFIDEGFGTLDPETLDQTLDTLERLQAESSKTIGIISHVEALKERIATQIQLERNGQGYSKIVVKG